MDMQPKREYPDDEFRRNWKPEHPEYVILWLIGMFLFLLFILYIIYINTQQFGYGLGYD